LCGGLDLYDFNFSIYATRVDGQVVAVAIKQILIKAGLEKEDY
jgi:hypothetical protein